MPAEQPRGTKDFGPSEAIRLNEIIDVIEATFRLFGYYPLETPAIENLSVMNAKAYGEESNKELYIIEGKEVGLRYDLTVPLARYVASNKDINLPFKRYQIGKVWRKDEPQKLRSREFVQADVDVVGSKEPASDAESIAVVAKALENLGITDYTVALNSRPVLNSILAKFGVGQELQTQTIRIIDKLAKLSTQEMINELTKIGVNKAASESMLNFMREDLDNEQKLAKLKTNIEAAGADAEAMLSLLKSLGAYGIAGRVNVDFSLARGLDYYTGFVWEFMVTEDGKTLPSIASGGRYDGLIGLYSKTSMPAVGTSIGVSRIFDILKGELLIKTYARAYVAYIGEANKDYAIAVANKLRAAGIAVDMNLTSRNLTKQLDYANAMRIKYAVIIGDKERSMGKAKLKDMEKGTEDFFGVEELASEIGK